MKKQSKEARQNDEKGKRTDEKIKKSLRYSILDGSFYSAMVGFGESFFSAFAIFLGATSVQLGLLGSLPQALGAISQLFTNKLLALFGNSRKRFVCVNAFLTALMYIPIALVYFFGAFKVYHLIMFTCIYWLLGTIISPAWNSWMGDLVQEDKRGTYFGRRNKIAGLTSFFALMIGGFILQNFGKGTQSEYYGFLVIFTLALISRIISFVYLTKKYEPKYIVKKEAEFGFLEFLRKARFSNYGHFVFYLSFMNFAVYLSGPFFTAYMLYDLKMDYMTFTVVTATALIVKYLMMPVWGKAVDRYGTKRVLALTGFILPLSPVLWLFSHETWYLLLIQCYSGFVWAGFEISSFNFIFDTTTPEKRATCVAYYNVLNGIAIFTGAMVGGFIIKYNLSHGVIDSKILWSSYMIVFLISGILRLCASIFFIPKLKEVREVKKTTYKKLFLTIITSMPTMGLVHNAIIITKMTKEKEKNLVENLKEFTKKHKEELIIGEKKFVRKIK
ncbi:MAG: MFS transporter [Nanoarchaeota archaeon]|nr:MFS transporter [Nanoarchaeota archaeon]